MNLLFHVVGIPWIDFLIYLHNSKNIDAFSLAVAAPKYECYEVCYVLKITRR